MKESQLLKASLCVDIVGIHFLLFGKTKEEIVQCVMVEIENTVSVYRFTDPTFDRCSLPTQSHFQSLKAYTSLTLKLIKNKIVVEIDGRYHNCRN